MYQFQVSSIILNKGETLPENIIEEWNGLLDRVEDKLRLFSYDWLYGWLRSIGETGKWTGKSEFIMVRKIESNNSKNILIGLTILAQQKVQSVLSVWSFAGYYQPWRSVLADKGYQEQVANFTADFISNNQLKFLQLGPLNMAIKANYEFVSRIEKKGHLCQTIRDVKLCIYNRKVDFEEYKNTILGKKLKRNVKYYRNKLKKRGSVETKHYSDISQKTITKIINEMSCIEQNSWLGEKGLPRFISQSAQKFWSHVLNKSCIPNKQLNTWIMYFNNTPISFCLTLTSGSACYVIANQYDSEYKEYRTGSIIYMEMMNYQFSQGITHWDFGDGDLYYKCSWGAQELDNKYTGIAVTNKWLARIVKGILGCTRKYAVRKIKSGQTNTLPLK